MASGWQGGRMAGSLTMCLSVKICPGRYSVSVLECADVGERKGREGVAEGVGCSGTSVPLVGSAGYRNTF